MNRHDYVMCPGKFSLCNFCTKTGARFCIKPTMQNRVSLQNKIMHKTYVRLEYGYRTIVTIKPPMLSPETV